MFLPHFLATDLGRILNLASYPMAFLRMGLASAGIELAFIASSAIRRVALAGHAVLLGHPFTALLLDRLASRDRFADRFDAVFVAGLSYILVASLANFLHAGFLNRFANLAANFTDVLFLHGLAYRVAAFANVLFAYLLANLVFGYISVRFIHGLADRIRALLNERLLNRLANGITALFEAGF